MMETSKAYNEGWKAGWWNKPASSNPYKGEDDWHKNNEWYRGFHDAKVDQKTPPLRYV